MAHMNKKMKKIIILSTLFLVLIIGAYKYFEWSSIKQIADFYNNSLLQDAQLLKEAGEKSGNLFVEFDKLLSDKPLDYSEQLIVYNNLINSINILINHQENTLNLTQNEYKKLASLEQKSFFLLGKTGNFARSITKTINNSYVNQLEVEKDTLLQNYVLLNTFNVWKDGYILTTYNSKGANNPSVYYKENFGEISTLEKYQKPDYKFLHEDELMSKYPINTETLIKYRDYFRLNYDVIKDYITDKIESASKKLTKLQDASVNINPNYVDLFGEGNEKRRDMRRKVIESNIDLIILLKKYKSEKPLQFLLSKKQPKFNDDFHTCLLYYDKLGYFADVTSKYPIATTLNEFLNELNTILPKTDVIDKQFSSDYINYSNKENNIGITCIDKNSNSRFVFNRDKSY